LPGTFSETLAWREFARTPYQHSSNSRAVGKQQAEALRKSTLALSQNLAMDSMLDTLLQCISELRSCLHDELCNFLWRLLHPSRASVGHLHFGRTLVNGHGNDVVWIDKYRPGSFSCLVCLAEFD